MTENRNKAQRQTHTQSQTQVVQATDDILTDYMDQLLLRTVVTDEVNDGTLVVDGEVQGWEPEAAEQQTHSEPVIVTQSEVLNGFLTETLMETQTETPSELPAGKLAETVTQTIAETATETVCADQTPPSAPIPEPKHSIQDEPAFDCLIIRAGEFRLGIPMTELGTIHTADRKPTLVPGQVSWILGSWPHDGRTMQVLDCLKLVMPERQVPMEVHDDGYYLQLGDSIWLLACDEVFEPVHTEHADVRWRASRKDRPWMAGIHKSEMCVVLDVAGLLSLTGSEV